MIVLVALFASASAEPPDPQALHARLVDAHGPAVGERVVADVVRIHHGQSAHPGDALVIGRFRETRWLGPDGDQQLEIEGRTRYPYEFPLDWSETIDGGLTGERRGADTFLGPKRGALSPARVGRRDKERLLASPAHLLAAIDPTGAEVLPDGALALHATWPGGPVTVVTDADASSVHAVRFVEDAPPLGDVAVEWRYDDNRGSPLAPWVVEQYVDGRIALREDRTLVERGDAPQVWIAQAAPAPAPLRYGWDRAMWLAEWVYFGFPQDADPDRFPLVAKRVAEGVTLITGAFHNSTVIELSDTELLLVEAPFSPEHADALFDLIAATWPDHGVRSVVLTHHHLDHAGGIRVVAERGLPLIVHPDDRPRVEAILARPSTVRPRPPLIAPELVPVDGMLVVQGTARAVEIHDLDNAHVEALLLVRVPDQALIAVPDLINPGLIPTRGPKGWLVRRIIEGIAPFNLDKAGAYGTGLAEALQARGWSPTRILGGHGPQVARPHALRVLRRVADPEAFEAAVAADAWPPP